VKFGNFMFVETREPERDRERIAHAVHEAQRSEELGVDALFLAEHHFDGVCGYVDPVAFAMALSTITRRMTLGFAVAQVSLHHPVRLAEQIALLDNLTEGRLIVGLGRGSKYNLYEYEGYGVPMAEAHERMVEAEQIMLKAWTGEPVDHRGRYWDVKIPRLRPTVFTRPHPVLIHAVGPSASVGEQAKLCRPVLIAPMNVERLANLAAHYRKVASGAGHSDAAISKALADSWCWRTVHVGDSDAEAKAVAAASYLSQTSYRHEINTEYPAPATMPASELTAPGMPLIAGTPETVAAEFRALEKTGIGGALIRFGIGPMDGPVELRSVERFMTEVAPEFRRSPAMAG
jgi:alkanesulfonate monooxygenase SsuD/methylene tetrahydromethanopterin reductase-like flavin-dependent oxidoreductase (luciferase family)